MFQGFSSDVVEIGCSSLLNFTVKSRNAHNSEFIKVFTYQSLLFRLSLFFVQSFLSLLAFLSTFLHGLKGSQVKLVLVVA